MTFTDRFRFFLDAIAKAKKLICESIAQNLKQVSLTKRFFSFGNGFQFTPIKPNLTAKAKNLFVSETCGDIFST